jgi:hypothetical protein
MAIKNLTESLDEMSQSFNLQEILGYEPTLFQLEMFGELAIDKIRERTEDGKDVNGRKFAPYSKQYAEQKGVSRFNVTLIDDQEMVEAINAEVVGENVLVSIDDDQLGKAYGHQSGYEGHPYLNGPKRRWFGLNTNEVKEIAKKVNQERVESNEVPLQTILDFIENF